MKKQILIGAVVLLAVAALGYAQEPEIKGTASLTYSGKYVWRGFTVYGAKSAIHPMVDLYMPNCSVGLSVEGHRANASGYENGERWDYSLYYLGKMFPEESYEMNYRVAYVYYNYPQLSSHSRSSIDLHEGHAALVFPKITGIEGLVPTYVLVKLMPVNSGTIVGSNSPAGGTASGFAHIFMLDYTVPMNCPLTGIDRKVNFHTEVVYNDGVAPDGGNGPGKYGARGPADSDWSHALFGVSTNYEIEDNLFLTPAIYYQSSWDKSVNNTDQYWASLGMSYKF